jgi:hypothetical protein
VELLGGWPKRITVAAHGPLAEHDTRLLTVGALNGVFQGRVDQVVNYVNASAGCRWWRSASASRATT